MGSCVCKKQRRDKESRMDELASEHGGDIEAVAKAHPTTPAPPEPPPPLPPSTPAMEWGKPSKEPAPFEFNPLPMQPPDANKAAFADPAEQKKAEPPPMFLAATGLGPEAPRKLLPQRGNIEVGSGSLKPPSAGAPPAPPAAAVLVDQLLPKSDPYFKNAKAEVRPHNPNYASLDDFQTTAEDAKGKQDESDESFGSLAFFKLKDLGPKDAKPDAPVTTSNNPSNNDFKVDPRIKMGRHMTVTEQNNKNYATLALISADEVLPKDADGVRVETGKESPQPNMNRSDFKVDPRIKMGRHMTVTEQNNKNYATLAFIAGDEVLPKDKDPPLPQGQANAMIPQPNLNKSDFKVDPRIKMGRHMTVTEQNNKNYATLAFIAGDEVLPKDAVGASPAKATAAPKASPAQTLGGPQQSPFKVDPRIKMGRHMAANDQNNKNYATLAGVQDFAKDE